MSGPTTIEVLATLPIDQRHGRHCEIKITKALEANGATAAIAVALFPLGDPTGIVIGVGGSRTGALADAQDTLQAALDAVDVAILKAARS